MTPGAATSLIAIADLAGVSKHASWANRIIVVNRTRVASDFTTRKAEVADKKAGFVVFAEFKPSKAQVLLQVALLKSSSQAEI